MVRHWTTFFVLLLCLSGFTAKRIHDVTNGLRLQSESGINRTEEQEVSTRMECEAWKSLRSSYLKTPVPLEQVGDKAWNFCRFLSHHDLRMVSQYGDRELYFECPHQPGGAFRLRVCLMRDSLPMCKLSLKYVHESINARGDFHMALSDPGAEFRGGEWNISGAMRFSRHDIKLIGDQVSFTFPSKHVDKFYLKESSPTTLARSKFDATLFTKAEATTVEPHHCPALNAGELKANPCRQKLVNMTRKFCETLHMDNVMYLKGSRGKTVSFTCLLTSEDRWDTAFLRAVFTKDGHRTGISSKWLLFDYMDLEDPTRFNIELDTDAYKESCIMVDIEEEGYRNGFVKYRTSRNGIVKERTYT
jgi:hypothetical protein